MRNKFKSLAAAAMLGSALLLGHHANGQQSSLPTYQSFNATGSTSAAILIPQRPNSQARVVCAVESSDKATSLIQFYPATTAHYTTAAATTSSTNIVLESTNGLTSTSQVYIAATGSNLVLTANSISSTGLGFASTFATNIPAGAEVELIPTTGQTIFGVGASSYKTYASDGLFVGNYGRAVYAVLDGTTACTNTITVHYDAQSQ